MPNEITLHTSSSEIVLYQPNDNIKLDVRINSDTVWLTRNQMATLFGRDVKTIGKHINNALREELASSVVAKNATLHPTNPTVAKFAIVQNEGSRMVEREVEHYSLDMILSVGYRVHSPQGIAFRVWANQVLKQYLLRGYSVNHQLIALQQHVDERLIRIEDRLQQHDEQISFFVRTNQPPHEGIVFQGHLLEGREVSEALIKSAKREVILIDAYVGADTFHILESREANVHATIYTENVGPNILTLQTNHEQEYGTSRHIEVLRYRTDFHDRFLIIDDDVYHFGASLKDLGKRLFAFDLMRLPKSLIMSQVAE